MLGSAILLILFILSSLLALLIFSVLTCSCRYGTPRCLADSRPHIDNAHPFRFWCAVMYVLYIANKNYSSWSLRPWVLMRELGIEFKEELRPFNPGSNWTAFRTFSPSGKVPCLVDGEHVVWDSLSIVEYLAERHPSVWPQDPGVRAWARSAAAEMHSAFGALRERCSMSCGIRVRLNDIPAALTRDIERMDELWTQGLDRFGGPFLTGQAFAAVDAFFAPIAFRAQTYGLKFKPRAEPRFQTRQPAAVSASVKRRCISFGETSPMGVAMNH